LGDPEGVVFIAGAVLNADKRSNFRLHYELSAGMLGIESLLYARLLQRLYLAFVEGIVEAAASSDASLDLKLRELTLQHLAVTPGHVAYATPDDLEARSTPAVPRPYQHDPFSCAACGHKRARSTYVLARPMVDVCTRTLDRRGIAPHRDVLSNRLVGVPSSPILCGDQVIQVLVGLASRRNPLRLAEYGLRVL
jgi:hypothetical protein